MAEVKNLLTRLEFVLTSVKLNYVIVGGIAVIHYGHIRTTQDIDLIIEDNPSKISQFLGLLKTYEFEVLENQFRLAYQERTNFSTFDKKSFLRLDIKVADKKREKEVLNNALETQILGLKLKIAPLEYVLLGKIQYIGNIGDIPESELLEYQDIIDFLTLFHANREKVNLTFLKEKVREIGLNKTLDILLSIDI